MIPFSPSFFCLFSPFPFVGPVSRSSSFPSAFLLTHDPPIYCVFKSFSLAPVCRAVFCRFLPISPPRSSSNSRTWFVTIRVGRSINQLIRVISSTGETRPIQTLVCPSARIRYWILSATFFDLTRLCSFNVQQISLSHRKPSPYLVCWNKLNPLATYGVSEGCRICQKRWIYETTRIYETAVSFFFF